MVSTIAPLTGNWIDLDRVFDRLLTETLSPSRGQATRANGVMSQPMPVDLYATDDEAVLIAALPGVRSEDINLSIHENTVTISGKIFDAAKSQEAKGATWYLRELWSGQFQRSVTLPFPIDSDRVNADFEDGILKIALPKIEQAKPKKITIHGSERSKEAIGERSNSKS